jgi:hypothetical protein
MALRLFLRIDLRRAFLGMVAAGMAVALPVASRAVPTPVAEKAYVAFFLGQGGYMFSWGIPFLESEARKLGLATDVFSYDDVATAWTNIARRRNAGYRIALVGYSLGNTTATYLQSHLPVDLLLAIAESSLGRNHPITKGNTKRAVLWYGPDTLSNAGVNDGFDNVNYVDSSHLMMDVDPRVVSGVLGELRRLATERHDEQVAAAKVPLPVPRPTIMAAVDASASEPEPAQQVSAGWLPPTNVITPDVTCADCWGFTLSMGAAEGDPWME